MEGLKLPLLSVNDGVIIPFISKICLSYFVKNPLKIIRSSGAVLV